MALLETFGTDRKEGYDNVQLVQQALLAYPFKPLEMFGAARAALSASNDLTVSEINCIPVVSGTPVKDIDHMGIARLFVPSKDVKLRSLFNQYQLNADTFVTVIFGYERYTGTFLITITQTMLGVIVTSVETKDIRDKDFIEKLKKLTVVEE